MPRADLAARTASRVTLTRRGATVLNRVVEWADRTAERLEGRGVWLFVALSVPYWLLTWISATRKLMWNDELYTFYIARLPSMRDVLAALMTGGEQLPPFFYAVTRLAIGLFGLNELSIRFPEMIAFWAMSACLFVIVSRQTSALSGLCAAGFPLVTTAYYYAFEGRPYALELAFASLAFLCWQHVSDRHRLAAIVGLAISLAATVSSHYYGVFVVVALALGEAVRTASRWRVDIAVWIALAVPALPLLLYLPLIRAGAAYSGAFWSPPQWVNVPDFYTDLLGPALVPVTVLLVISGVISVAARPPVPAAQRPGRSPLPHEIAAVCALILIPVACVVLAKLATGAFVNRYAVAAVIGFAVLAGFGVGMVFGSRPAMRLITVACLVSWFVLSQAREFVEPTGRAVPVTSASVEQPSKWLHAAGYSDLPLVVADPHTFTVLSHYGAPDIRRRIVYVADPDLALKHLGNNSVERGMLDLVRPWFGMHVVRFDSFLTQHHRFLIYGNFGVLAFLNWIVQEVQARGMHTELLNGSADHMLLLAYADTRSSAAPAPVSSGPGASTP
jgi:hypothetical protein